MITVSTAANNYIQQICSQQQKKAVRLEVKGGGCSGYVYQWSFVDAGEPGDFTVDLGPYIFIVDSMSLLFVAGTELDYKQDIAGSSLYLKNPNERSSCGCGKSFNI